MNLEFQRVVIVNRGEAAMRFIHAAREFNEEQGTAFRTIALFTDPDRNAMFVREADESVYLGPAHVPDYRTQQPISSYVDYDRLSQALAAARADAVWVGWGFVAEHAAFADLCRGMGIVFIGPDGDVMRRLGDKISSKLLAEQNQIPVLPWSGGPVETVAEAERHAQRLGFPLLIKATAGGGGHGIRLVHSLGQLAGAFERARAEAYKAFGDSTVFLEKRLQDARHVEVQIIADHFGRTMALGVRDCTIQRRHQKILEEAPSPVLSSQQDKALREAAMRLSRAAGYVNAGTVEFLHQPGSHHFWFMEMNTRLQVEHPVTERTTGVDIVKLQIKVARGGRLQNDPPRTVGHAIEVRLNAEDPNNNFAPAPGKIERFRIPTGLGIRVDTGVAEGDSIAPEFDSMIAKIIAYGQTRKEALSRLQRVLRESVVVIKGGASNKAFLLELLKRSEVQRAEVHNAWMDSLAATGDHISRRYADVAMVQAAVEAYDANLALEQAQFYASAVRGRPKVCSEIGHHTELRYRGNSYSATTCQLGPRHYCVEIDGTRIDVYMERLDAYEYWLTMFGQRFHVVSVSRGLNYCIEVNGVAHNVERGDGGLVRASAPAVIVSIAVQPGDMVSAGDGLVVLEAMKMEMQIVAPFSGRVRQVLIRPNVQVDTGAPLVQIEPSGAGEELPPEAKVVFGSSVASNGDHDSRSLYLEDIRQFLLGFDVSPMQAARSFSEWNRCCPVNTDIAQVEDEILNIFVDICALFRRDPEVNGRASGEQPGSEYYLLSYLRMLETAGQRLPGRFLESLRTALGHYGVTTLDRSQELEDGLFWIYKSHQRVEQQATFVQGLLERRLQFGQLSTPHTDESFRTFLDRMVAMSNGYLPAVSDVAREVRYRYFDQPLFERSRKEVYEQVEGVLTQLGENPNPPDRAAKLRSLVECPQPIVGLLSSRFATSELPMRQLMLEAITLRYYRIRTLQNFRSLVSGERCFVSAEYDHNEKHVHVLATHADYSRIGDAVRATLPLIAGIPPEHDVVLDFYLWHSGHTSDPETLQVETQEALNQVSFPHPIRRIAVEVAGTISSPGAGGMQHFTYRLSEAGYQEEKLYRGIHPMMAKRLHLWRLSNFNIERLPSVEDVYLVHAVARDNPKDERLFASVEVRDVTPVRDATGQIVQLPHLERMLREAIAAMRLFQLRRPANRRLHWNRIFLYVWPPVNLSREELDSIIHRLSPAADGLGLEQVVVRAQIPDPQTGKLRDMIVRISNPADCGILITFRTADKLQPIKPMAEYEQKVVRMRQRGLIYPYEIIKMLTPAPEHTRAEFPPGDFVEYDLDADGTLVPVLRPYGQNRANIIVGVIRNFTKRYPEGMRRVMLLGDPSKDLGALAEPECRRINAALDLAEEIGVPLEWFPISAGAKISMSSGVENMDWIARVLRRLVEFTQSGGEVNLLVNGINVGAQPYWNAEATMLMHTRGILVMTPKAAMVLTGKRALDYSGGISADDNQGIGGYERIMGINGQAQYWAHDIDEACHILFRHYDHTYLAPGERFPRPAKTSDPIDRDVQTFPHESCDEGFTCVGDIMSDITNPARKKSFDIRTVMMAAIDQDHAPLERWAGMSAAETTVIWDAHLGGYPVCLIGIESRPMPRLGFVPADGPEHWTSGTLFPQSSKKAARAINAASNNRPVVMLANLSGFDGSPESMRRLQLEYGAEIGRAVVNFEGPIVFCVISRYHGGAYVVFSSALNENLEIAALEGTYASVIGGAPAAAVVFASEVEARTHKDPRVQELTEAMSQADGSEKNNLRKKLDEVFKTVHSEKLGEIAAEFDRVHSVQRALDVGALHRIIAPANLRPYLIDAIERGMLRAQERFVKLTLQAAA